jgi:hypothetical protein
MIIVLRQFMLIGALLGLLWHGVASATPPCADMQLDQNVAMTGNMADAMAGMPDCMGDKKQSLGEAPPCKDMKAGCVAMFGFPSLAALDAFPISVNAPTSLAASFSSTSSPIMLGRNEAPIPDPPLILG